MIFEELTLQIPSSPKHIYKVERFIEEICDKHNISNTYFGNISIALMEAVENAIKHGNENNEEKKVTIMFNAKKGKLKFIIKDEGEGFNYKNIKDPTDITNDTSGEEGRGIYMIKALADEVSFNEEGNAITLKFALKGIDELKAKERGDKLKKYSSKSSITKKQSTK